MTVSIDKFFFREMSEDYDCLDFTREVWSYLTGEDIGQRLENLIGTGNDREIKSRHRRAFVQLETPESPCLAMMQRPHAEPHAGVYYEGRILHIHDRGVEFQLPEIAARAFVTVEYYKCRQ